MTAVQRIAQIDLDRTFDPNETCARCGPRTRAQFKWVFPSVSRFAHEHSDLYLCLTSPLWVSVGCSPPASSTWPH
jgi:hypothetical protein